MGTPEVWGASALAAAGRDIPASFAVRARIGAQAIELELRELRRVLPGRRIAAATNWGVVPAFAKLFFGPQAARDCEREVAGHALLVNAGVACAELLGRGTFGDGGEVVVFTFVAGDPLTLERVPAAMWTLARLHDVGISHADLHPDNLLCQGDTVFVVDGGAVTARGSPFVDEARIRDIANLLAQFSLPGADHTDDALAAYASAVPRMDTTRWLQRLESAFEVALRARVRRYVDKTLRDCTEFCVAQSPRRFLAGVRTEMTRLAAFIGDPDAHVAAGEVIKNGNSATVGRIESDGALYVVKRYNMKSMWHRLTRAVRASRASRAWQNGHRLRMLSIATAEPLLLLEDRLGPLRGRAYLLMRALTGPDLASVDPLDHLTAIVELFDGLRRGQLIHGDTKATNFVLHAGRLCLIDLDGMYEASGTRFAREHAKDIARFLDNWAHAPAVRQALAARIAAAGAATAGSAPSV